VSAQSSHEGHEGSEGHEEELFFMLFVSFMSFMTFMCSCDSVEALRHHASGAAGPWPFKLSGFPAFRLSSDSSLDSELQKELSGQEIM
jgi:hypothetical protein